MSNLSLRLSVCPSPTNNNQWWSHQYGRITFFDCFQCCNSRDLIFAHPSLFCCSEYLPVNILLKHLNMKMCVLLLLISFLKNQLH